VITLWYSLVVLCWVLFFVLEGFDFGVGMLAPLLGRDDHERGAAISTVGPFWDGNEVWLVAAVGVTFAAFPSWYAALLSALYLPVVALLLLLAIRGVALEFRGKADGVRWRRGWEAALAVSSAGIAALWGAVLAVLVHGLALGPDGSVTGSGVSRSVSPLLSVPALLGALAGLLAAGVLGATFLALRTTGPVRLRARRVAVWLPAGGALVLAVAGAVSLAGPSVAGSFALAAGAVLALTVGLLAHFRREAPAFATAAVGVAATVVSVFTAHGEVVLRSTLSPAWSLTITGAAATDSALRLLTAVGVLVLPGVLVYQAFSYWVFRRRVASERIPS
jgi:cytochrome d ubiquinol oxidase subunit II